MVQTTLSSTNKNKLDAFTMTVNSIKLSQSKDDKVKSKNCSKGCGIFCLAFQILLIMVIMVMVGLMLATYVAMFKYQLNNFDSNVEIDIEYPETTNLPAVTVCNMYNGIQKSKYCDAFPERCENYTIINFDSEIFKEELSIEKRLKYLQQPQEFISMAFGQDIYQGKDGIEIDPSNFTRIYFEPMINCFTGFARWNRNSTDPLTARDESALFMELNFEVMDQANPQELFINPIGGFVYVHDSNSVPDIFHWNGYEIQPNDVLSLGLEKTVHHRLPLPYKTKCHDYGFFDGNGSNAPLSQKQCFGECMYEKFMNVCGCIPLYWPQISIKHRVECQYSNNVKVANCFEKMDKSIRNSCEHSCPLGCDEEEYTAKVTRTPVGKDVREMSNSTAYVSIEFGYMKETHYYHMPASDFSWKDVSLFLLWLLVEIALFSHLIRLIIRSCCVGQSHSTGNVPPNLDSVCVQPTAEDSPKEP